MNNQRKKDKIRELLARSDRGVGHASGISGVLTKLFHTIMAETGLSVAKWNYLINEYAMKEVSHQDNRRDLASIRGNLNKEFSRPRMSWKVFCKAMMFLQIRRFKIIIVAEWEDGRMTQHTTMVEASTVFEKNRELNIPTPRPVPQGVKLTPANQAECERDQIIEELVQSKSLLIDSQKE